MSVPAGAPTNVAEPSLAGPVQARRAAWIPAAYFLFCLAVQFSTGAWQASFTAYPDEASHFVGGVMVRDWLVSGEWSTPGKFAQNYYDHYPFFAVGYWPPAFHVATALVLLAAGVGRMQALLVPAAFAAATAWLIFGLLRRRAGPTAAFCAGALYLGLPVVQRWFCAVMVDHMSACLSVAAAASLIAYFAKPDYRNGFLTAFLCAAAILSKYSAAYTVALPWAAILLLRRFELVRKPSMLMQPAIVAAMVGPWALWTRDLAYYGLPSGHRVLGAARMAQIVERTLGIFPPALLVFTVLGLAGLLALPRPWRRHEDTAVVGIFCVGHLLFLFLSPVGPEPRYLLTPAACLLILSFTGWAAALSRMPEGRGYGRMVPVSAAVLTLAFVAVYQGRYQRPRQYGMRGIVKAVVEREITAGDRVVVPSDVEGPFIAEFVSQVRRRPTGYLLRPSKVFARSDWFGDRYSPIFRTPEQVLEYFRRNPVRAVVWHASAEEDPPIHERILNIALERDQALWRRMGDFGAEGGTASWAIYEQAPGR